MSPVEHLQEIRKLIEKGFAQKSAATDDAGRPVPIDDPSATCYCIYGAALIVNRRITGRRFVQEDPRSWHYLESAVARKGAGSPITYNDDHTQEEVLGLIDQAIKLAEESHGD